MCLVIFSGFGGVYVYMRYPSLGARTRSDHSRIELFVELADLNDSVRELGKQCESDIQAAVESAVDRTTIGGGVLAQLLARDSSKMLKRAGSSGQMGSRTVSNKDQAAVVDYVGQRIPRSGNKDDAATLQDLLARLCRRQTLLRKIRKDIQLKGWMQVWLYIHIPMTIALLIALSIHILSVFFYW